MGQGGERRRPQFAALAGFGPFKDAWTNLRASVGTL
jgi:hypothetical protein